MKNAETVVGDLRRWLERAVIGLNLCPFAKAVYVKEQVHFAVCCAQDEPEILQAFERELDALMALDPAERDTTLLALPAGMDEFLDFNALAARAGRLLRRRKLEGVVQIATFHPHFVFADADDADLANFTNRAPYPVLQILRESSIERAVAAFPDPAAIYETNIETLHRLGAQGWAARGVEASR